MGKGWRYLTLSTVLSWTMKFLLMGLFAYYIYIGDYLFSLAPLLAIVLSLLPNIVERSYHIHLPFEVDLLVTLALFLHIFLGEGFMFYEKLPYFDDFLHVYGTAVISLLAFMSVYTMHYIKKIRLSIPLIGFFTVIFAMAMGACWEMAEYVIDKFLGGTMQNGLSDTMLDLMHDLLGGSLVAIIGMIYVKYSNPRERRRLTRTLGEVFEDRSVKEK